MGHTGPSCERCGRVVGDARKTAHRWFERAKQAYSEGYDLLDMGSPGWQEEWRRLMDEGDRWGSWGGSLMSLLWRHEAREVFA